VRTREFTVVRHTRNYQIMRKFYEEIMGMKTVREWDRGSNDRGVLLSPGELGGNALIEIIQLNDVAVPNAPAPVNIELSLEVENVNGVYNHLLQNKMPIARKLMDDPWGHSSFGIDDPEGLRIWVYQVHPQ
jgi:catechol 2,3-dioxygenase-like lactoylglutathione lyase family enzyme